MKKRKLRNDKRLKRKFKTESFTKAQLESKRKEVRDQLASTKTKAELLEEDDNAEAFNWKQTLNDLRSARGY